MTRLWLIKESDRADHAIASEQESSAGSRFRCVGIRTKVWAGTVLSGGISSPFVQDEAKCRVPVAKHPPCGSK